MMHARTRHSYRSVANAVMLTFLPVPRNRPQHTVHATQLGQMPYGCPRAVLRPYHHQPTEGACQNSQCAYYNFTPALRKARAVA